MGYTIRFLPTAKNNVKEIKQYLSQFYPNTPKRFTTSLKNALEGLKTMPYMCPAYETLPPFRKMVVANYLVFYTINDEQKLIEIHRVLPGTWDVEKHLRAIQEYFP
jgi:plasmid stabilization system protein ParE